VSYVTQDELTSQIDQATNALRTLTEFEGLTNALAQDGDGLSITALSGECAAVDPDEIAAKEQTVTQEVNELRDRLMEVRENLSNARLRCCGPNPDRPKRTAFPARRGLTFGFRSRRR
jgi:hypothetical protein